MVHIFIIYFVGLMICIAVGPVPLQLFSKRGNTTAVTERSLRLGLMVLGNCCSAQPTYRSLLTHRSLLDSRCLIKLLSLVIC